MAAAKHRLYVGTIGEGLWRSLDSGASFTRACDGMFVECHVRALAVHPHQPEILYLGSELGLFRSTDGAENWSRVESPLNGRQIWSILVHPTRPELLLVGTCPAALFRSDDGGRIWSEADAPIQQECPRILWNRVTTLRADPDQPDALWAGVEIDGLFRSRDSGRTWQPTGTRLSSRDIHDLAFVAGNGSRPCLLAATNNDLNLSTDDGIPGSRWKWAGNYRGAIAGRWRGRWANRMSCCWGLGTGRRAPPAWWRVRPMAALPGSRQPCRDGRTAPFGILPCMPPTRRSSTPAASAARCIARPTAAGIGRSCRREFGEIRAAGVDAMKAALET